MAAPDRKLILEIVKWGDGSIAVSLVEVEDGEYTSLCWSRSAEPSKELATYAASVAEFAVRTIVQKKRAARPKQHKTESIGDDDIPF